MRRSTALIVAFTFVVTANHAAAYQIMETRDGVPIFWDQSEVSFVMDASGTDQLSLSDAEQAITDSLDAWGLIPSTELAINYDGRVQNEVVGFDWEHNVNLIAFYDGEWTFSQQALAITLSTWSVPDGHLLDADVAVNSADYDWAVDGRAGSFDLASALTHEFGHAVGLGHSEVHEATMFASMTTGEVQKRDLHGDDENGYVFLYGAEDVVQPDEPTAPPVDDPHTDAGDDTPSDYQPPNEPSDDPEMPTPDPEDDTTEPEGNANDQPADDTEPTPDQVAFPDVDDDDGATDNADNAPTSETPDDYDLPEASMSNFELSCSATGAVGAGNLTPVLMLLAGLLALARRRRGESRL